MSSEEVDKLKDEGNKLFAAKEWLKSASKYTQAIKADPNNAVLYSNRSAALLKLLKVTKATEDADTCIKLKPEWEKGYFRKGAILEEQDKLGEVWEWPKVYALLLQGKQVQDTHIQANSQ
ncbi:hypothetical protein DUNSADRAFT_4198 [Dunaliella salina]|uniref:Uncharacterized protein n=1 Tax=Dunaliella salina TaxID=3046 RepID=A0ABQ7GSG8_DUNSA|nr:hypothetical protein DUNSADRAFT_4198 [Dunaliella salina]|eukprot:KAF5837562.1 hypothetical protein DUNSADRAFT_4198 [Dunaliella salina]